MIYGNLFSKLLKEDLKRRTWAVALTFLVFFFSLPIGLALALEGAENTNYVSFNLIMKGHLLMTERYRKPSSEKSCSLLGQRWY